MASWTNPKNVDLENPYLYFIRITSPTKEWRYVGKGSKPSRMDAYARNVERVLAGKPKRPAVKRDGTPQSEGNIKFRFVHLVLAAAVKNGWRIDHYPLQNCSKAEHTAVERQLQQQMDCNMNHGPTWFVEDFERLSEELS